MDLEKQPNMNPLYPLPGGTAPPYNGQPITIQMDPMNQMGGGYINSNPQSVPRPHTAVILVNSNAKPALGLKPQRLTCPACNTVVLTHLRYRAALKTHLIAGALCITGLFFLAPIPYCVKICKRLDHYCSNCDEFIGKAS